MNSGDDIVQIRKYLNGELDTRAMHELERRVLDDPFLADALEGFEQSAGDQQGNQDELSARLQKRIAPKEGRIFPWKPLSIAASLLIIIGAGIWVLSGHRQQDKSKVEIADNVTVEKKEQSQSPVVSTPVSSDTPEAKKDIKLAEVKKPELKTSPNNTSDKISEPEISKDADSQPVASSSPQKLREVAVTPKPKTDSVSANEVIVASETQKKKADSNPAPVAAGKLSQATETLLKSRADGVTTTPGQGKTITGSVYGSDDRQPIPGATVKLQGKPFGVVTNAEGKFVLPNATPDQIVSVNFIGYNAKKVKITNSDSLNISLEPTNSSLNEVVVAGNRNNNGETTSQDAHPANGWKAYNGYLEQNAASPDGKTGKVKISFVVAADGSLAQFKVIKSLSEAADKKATDLISNGPKWIGNSDGKPKEVKLSIAFK